MNFWQDKYGSFFCVGFLLLLLTTASCQKELYFDRAAAVLPVDSLPTVNDPGSLPGCVSCLQPDSLNPYTWSFKTGASQLCGKVDTAIISIERSSFTFFGPSNCSRDTGLIFTIFLDPHNLTRDTANLKATYATFYYYNTGAPYILLSKTAQSFNFTISSYVHATRIAIGTFSGFGYRQNGRAVEVTSGKFKIRLR